MNSGINYEIEITDLDEYALKVHLLVGTLLQFHVEWNILGSKSSN